MLDIIGPGFGRTGTYSLKIALEHLGFGPAHHMFEVRDNPHLLPAWESASRGERIDLDAAFAGYRSQVDWPGARLWRELAAHFPAARVVLTVRDPDLWYDSVSRTILPFVEARGNHPAAHPNAIAEMANRLIVEQVFDGRLADRDHAIAVYRAHIEEVRRTIAPERLLVFEVAQGWEPLCRFLDCEVPTVSFPRLNSTRQFFTDEWQGAGAPA